MTTKGQIEKTLWDACGSFRNKIDSSIYKDYILSMLFVKYLSDTYKEKKVELEAKYGMGTERTERMLSRERFHMAEETTFQYLYKNRNTDNIGEIINKGLAKIEEENKGKLTGVFRNIDFNSAILLGEIKERKAILKNLLEDVNKLDLTPSQLEGGADIIGDSYEYLIAKFASDAGKKGGEFFTPSEVSELLARLVKPRDNDRIYDPTCGSGSLLIRAYKQVKSGKAALYGQEVNGQTQSLARMNMFLHDVDDATIWRGDTLANPQNIEGDKLMKFRICVANPPFSLDKWASGFAGEGNNDDKFKMEASMDPYGRFKWSVPPSSKGDYAFVLHMINSLDENDGTMGVVLPHGVLFRGGSEAKIRKQILDNNLLDAVIGLPANLFYGTGIPACILILKKNRPRHDVLFIDASGDENYEKGKNQNILRERDIAKIVDTYEKFSNEDKYSFVATKAMIEENDYNLNIPRYVDTFEEEEIIDIEQVNKEILSLEAELVAVKAQMAEYLKKLGLE